ncbi:MAG: lysozyme [Nitrospiraceae bacterium]|nr:MAG: lysozyme [Nitrospiraceae bacterium]
MIRAAEGTDGPDGYRTFFGYRFFDSYADHPTELDPSFRAWEPWPDDSWIRNGRRDYTTAAGAYQITLTTWRRLKERLGLRDFSPESQDRAAVELIREKGALADVWAGRFDEAVRKLGSVWASLPSAATPQPKRTWAFVRQAYLDAGGTIA